MADENPKQYSLSESEKSLRRGLIFVRRQKFSLKIFFKSLPPGMIRRGYIFFSYFNYFLRYLSRSFDELFVFKGYAVIFYMYAAVYAFFHNYLFCPDAGL